MRKFMFSANWWLSKSREWPKQNESVWYVRDCKPFVRQFAIWYGRLRLFKSAKEIPRTDPHCLIKTFSFNAWNVADISHFHLDNLKIPLSMNSRVHDEIGKPKRFLLHNKSRIGTFLKLSPHGRTTKKWRGLLQVLVRKSPHWTCWPAFNVNQPVSLEFSSV
jgi:hypothetical protein